jgi:NodT family efflux transporter outer membrane factor (OMF) lipoprotein
MAIVLMMAAGIGCAVGPRYSRPAAQTPAAWKSQPPWQQAAPKDSIPKGAWWEIFRDPQLNAYEQQLLRANQSLIAAHDRLELARALARVANAALYPQVSVNPEAYRARISGNRQLNGVTTPSVPVTQNFYSIPFTATYEADLFGRVRNNIRTAKANLQTSAADLQNVQLVLASELAADYFTLRELDAELLVVQKSVDYERRGLELVQYRHKGGIVSGLDVAQQAALLDATLAQLSLVKQQRDQFEHAIATLVGVPASNFSVSANPLGGTPPPIPLGIPSDLLERRPDIATAERQMAAQNAQVGLAQSAFYPLISFTTAGGVLSRDITTLASAPSLFWSIGTDALAPVFQGGRLRANLAAARASYDESVANYRQSVLTAFQQVEDGISSLNSLSQAAASQNAAVEEARRQLAIANNRYTTGVATYLDVITAQSTLLSNERLATQLLGQQMVASVSLIKALGGGWDATALQSVQAQQRVSVSSSDSE